MQHYGAPSRLLDFTYSFFIALHFALESAMVGQECTVWAVDRKKIRENAISIVPTAVRENLQRDKSAKGDAIFVPNFLRALDGTRAVYPLNPFRQTARHLIQQGVFICQFSITENFTESFQRCIIDEDQCVAVKIDVVCTEGLLRKALEYLYRINITRASLFPGLDGFGRSLDMLIHVPEAIPPGR